MCVCVCVCVCVRACVRVCVRERGSDIIIDCCVVFCMIPVQQQKRETEGFFQDSGCDVCL